MVRWYSPTWIVLPRSAAASFRSTLNSWTNGAFVENWLLSKVATGYELSGGKVTVAGSDPIGPTMCRSAAFDSLVQGAEVMADIGTMSVPSTGVMVRKPRLPAGGSALATPLTSNADPAATATTAVPETSHVNNLFLCTM